MSEDQEKSADDALYRLGQALADLRRLQATPEGEKFLFAHYALLASAYLELRELRDTAAIGPFNVWSAA